ncbi:hypothetical protein BDA96_10G095700 [Sorghum bicolor]|uniref:Uncharacterized protein n=1 Tax=Sorghum bicolor TaxID=4558 RepID=A0A921Q404_SORBI|nr:hypothetical protein BDA96_10G095700 [Sorghum bicolor]
MLPCPFPLAAAIFSPRHHHSCFFLFPWSKTCMPILVMSPLSLVPQQRMNGSGIDFSPLM